jgi:hypothetical protein
MKGESAIQELSIFVALILVILTSGCATRMYQGGQLPKEQVAIIKGEVKPCFFRWSVVGVDSVVISYVDKKLVKYATGHMRVEVMPGSHKVLVEIKSESSNAFGHIERVLGRLDLEFNAEAGHEYKIKAMDIWKPRPFIVVIDNNTDTVILKKRFTRLGERGDHLWAWFKPDTTIEQLKQDYSECGAKGQEKSCMKEKGYTWAEF